jgi:UDP-N-acetylmuramate: L-alanyl-gamma-D-glutamyl-meso-diaminopimelate ligase
MELSADKPIYFLGIGGTGMAATAGLAQAAGYKVIGSDANLYPPMSTMLAELEVPVKTPYSTDNLTEVEPQLVVVANALSRGHPELEAVLSRQLPYTSFPQFLGETFLKHRTSIVVSGTHGKTTTSSLLAYMLAELKEDPSFLIGGIPRNFPRSFQLGKGPTFIIEGDEYDTAFFDKNSKFLHYHPQFLILNNLEFDHADIFKDIDAIERQFDRLLQLVPDPSKVIANCDDPGLMRLLRRLNLSDKVCRVSGFGHSSDADYRLTELRYHGDNPEQAIWQIDLDTKDWGPFSLETSLAGPHNAANIMQVIACIAQLAKHQIIRRPDTATLQRIIHGFAGVARRLDHLAAVAGIDVFEDFAHHPTAVSRVLQGMRTAYPKRRLIAAFEPKNATSRRNIFTDDFAQALSYADRIYIGPCPYDKRLEESQRMNTDVLANQIGHSAQAFPTNEDLLEAIVADSQQGDVIVFMSPGSFSGVQYKMRSRLAERHGLA